MADGEIQVPGTSKKRRHSETKENSNSKKNIHNNVDEVDLEIQCDSAFHGRTQTCKVDLSNFPTVNVFEIFNRLHKDLQKLSKDNVLINENVRVCFELIGIVDENEYEPFNIKTITVLNNIDVIDKVLGEVKDSIHNKFIEYDQINEGIKQFLFLNVHFDTTAPNSGYVPLPNHISSRQVVAVSYDYPSNKSFLWAVLSALHPDVEPEEEHLHDYSDELVMDDIQYPVKLDDIPKIEEMNDISFNVFMLQYSSGRDQIQGPVYYTKNRKPTHINLLLLHDEGNSQYTYISDLRSLVNPEKTGHICDGCLIFFDTTNELNKHQNECLRVKTVLKSPSDNIMKFSNHQNNQLVPIVVYADFEAFLKPIKNIKGKNSVTKDTFTKNVEEHIPYGYSYYIKCGFDDSLSKLRVYIGVNCVEKFITALSADIKILYNSKDTLEANFVPVYFHNFGGYDSHFLLKYIDGLSILGAPNRPMALFKNIFDIRKSVTLRFLDSYAFLKEPLEQLTENLRLEPEKFVETRASFDFIDDEQFKLLNRKGVLPYDYIKSYENFKDTSLPKKEHFYNKLNECHITDDDYDYALNVWNSFQCKNLGQYVKLYMKTDVLFLADVFENFRQLCLRIYKLDPAYYYSVAALSLDAMFKHTNAEIELLTDVGMLMFFKNGIRAGIAHCCKRHAVANNDKIPETYDAKQPESYLMYYDANNLYGYAMSQPLPYGGFEWVDDKDLDEFDYDVPADSEVGYVLEVDLTYPEELHNSHADLPFCAGKKKIPNCGDIKFITDLGPKDKYVIHYLHLRQCIDHGLKLKKIHRILKFNQKPWLKSYIDHNTEMRTHARTKTEKDFFKLMNNSIYGKLCENIEKYSKVKMFAHWFKKGNWRGAYNMVGRPDYNSRVVCSENSLAVQLKNTVLDFNKPIYVGFCVLELAKIHMYKFHYDVMKKKFGDNLQLLYTDTDSLLYQIFTTDYYGQMRDILEKYFDTSDYDVDNPFKYPCLNKKKIGFFKDELNGDIIKEFVALRQKVYYIYGISKKKNTAGVPRKITDNLSIEDYKTCLYKQEILYKEMFRISPICPNIYTQHIRKVALSPKYNGRCVLENLIDTLPWGHYKLLESSPMQVE